MAARSPEEALRGLVAWVGILNCTVLMAATSQPRVCMTNAAILLPTYLYPVKLCVGRAR